MSPTTAIVWYRRDLRVHDHPALSRAAQGFDRVVPLFVFDPRLLHGRAASASRTAFMLGCLRELDEALRERGSALVLRHGRPEEELLALAPDAVLWTSDVSPFARARDARVTEVLRDAGIEPIPSPGNYIADVSKVRKADGGPFTVFAPFHRAWLQAPRRDVVAAPDALPPLPDGLDTGTLPDLAALGVRGADVDEPFAVPGEAAGLERVDEWLSEPVSHYADRQDGMARKGTSGLSPYLRWGCVSPRALEQRVIERDDKGARSYRRQLGWRDFYAQVLLNFPGNVDEEFQERFRGQALDVDSDPERLAAWKEGRTGFPLVDAGMRQLARTGWMHNRCRLVVGSFLTKDLHLDFREGERHFSDLLYDGEPAQNNGNWQWIASVGVDPAPYFQRMFNPTLQAQKFDPEGTYIRRWVPELAEVPAERIHEPWTMPDAEQEAYGCVIGRDYPAPIVDHLAERKRAMERYRTAISADKD